MDKVIKVSKTVHPVHRNERKPFPLVIGETYYVCFGENKVRPCRLVGFLHDGKFIRIEYNTRWHTHGHQLYPDEIGRTPEEAVINQVTF